MKSQKKVIEVTAAIIRKGDLIFLARRPEGKHLAGFWEFPGGKIEEGETPEECLGRELGEELEIKVRIGNHIMDNLYEYDDIIILLKVYQVEITDGIPSYNHYLEHYWVNIDEILGYKLAPADVPVANLLISKYNESRRPLSRPSPQ
jgi:8-oxo-dGTP diphosphatase